MIKSSKLKDPGKGKAVWGRGEMERRVRGEGGSLCPEKAGTVETLSFWMHCFVLVAEKCKGMSSFLYPWASTIQWALV